MLTALTRKKVAKYLYLHLTLIVNIFQKIAYLLCVRRGLLLIWFCITTYKSNVRERSCIIRPTVSGHLLRYKYVFDVLGIWWIWIWRWKYCIADLQFYLSKCICFAWYYFCILKAVTTSGFFLLIPFLFSFIGKLISIIDSTY